MKVKKCRECGWIYDIHHGIPDPEHPCPAYAAPINVPDASAWPTSFFPGHTDTSFIAQARNSSDGMERYHRHVRGMK